MINSHFVNITIAITGFLSLLIAFFPNLDIAFSQIFFSTDLGFIYKKSFGVLKIYRFLPLVTNIFTISCLAYLIYISVKHKNFGKTIRSAAFFLLISAAINPGLIINSVLKENIGRARPLEIQQFGGSREFTAAYMVTDQCDSNCSFPSGHAAMGYFFTAIAYIARRKYFNKIYVAGLIFGSVVGFSRILMGGHFFSDVLTSAFIVLFLNHLIFIIWQKIVNHTNTSKKAPLPK